MLEQLVTVDQLRDTFARLLSRAVVDHDERARESIAAGRARAGAVPGWPARARPSNYAGGRDQRATRPREHSSPL